jgi:hypothetical protein
VSDDRPSTHDCGYVVGETEPGEVVYDRSGAGVCRRCGAQFWPPPEQPTDEP